MTYPDTRIHFIFNEMNFGFTIICNQAIKPLQNNGFCGYFWSVKNDTLVMADTCKNLLQKAGITRSKIIFCRKKEEGIVRIHPFWSSVKKSNPLKMPNMMMLKGHRFFFRNIILFQVLKLQ